MAAPFNPALYDSEGNLIVPRHGIRIAMAVAALAAAAFFLFNSLADRKWHQVHPGSGASGSPDPLWMVALWAALPLVPLVLSWLLLSARREDAITAGAGVALSLSVNCLLFALAAAVGFFFGFAPDSYGVPVAISIVIVLVCSAWTIVSAFRIGAKAGWGVFFLAAAVTLVSMAVAHHFLWNEDRDLDRQNEWRKRQAAIVLVPDREKSSKNYAAEVMRRDKRFGSRVGSGPRG